MQFQIRDLIVAGLSTVLLYFILLIMGPLILMDFAFQGDMAYITFIVLFVICTSVMLVLPAETVANTPISELEKSN